MEHVLDNPVWSALTTGNAAFALGNELAKYYQPEVSPFASVKTYSRSSFDALYEMTPEGAQVAIFTDNTSLSPAPWQIITRIEGFQMMFTQSVEAPDYNNRLEKLAAHHVPKMLELTSMTKPGPFLPGTIELGNYEGILDKDRLLAMAGYRFHSEKYVEISAVCTHPDYQGRGYARQPILNQISQIQRDGNEAYLHVRADNKRAIEVYKNMGFTTRKEMFIYVLNKN